VGGPLLVVSGNINPILGKSPNYCMDLSISEMDLCICAPKIIISLIN
jgi:hypothetical protein